MPGLLSLLVLFALQEEPPVRTGSDRGSAVRLQLTGHVDLRYAYRSAEVGAAALGLNGLTPGSVGSDNFWSGRIGLRADVEVKDFVTGVVELENRSFEDGANLPFSDSPTDSTLDLRQGYLEVGQFLTPELALRLGVQNVVLRNRPHDDPFFLDLGESESFFSGFSAADRAIGSTADRDFGQATGARAFWSPAEILTVQAFAMVYEEGGGTPHDESVYGVVANSLIAEHWAVFLLLVASSGGDPGLSTVYTGGAGIDGYFGDAKELELFAEIYGQGGALQRTPDRIRKEAYAVNLGARYLGLFTPKLWIEAAWSHRSGDRRAGDDHDQAFQSYENVNRFLILESGEFGLDLDTNLSQLRAGLGAGPFDVAGRPLRVQVDVGRFVAVTPPVAGDARDWGIESDLTVRWDYNESLTFSLKGADLTGSEVFEQLTGHRHAWLFLLSAGLKF